MNEGLSCALTFGRVGGRLLWHGTPAGELEGAGVVVGSAGATSLTPIERGSYQLAPLSPAGPAPIEVVLRRFGGLCNPVSLTDANVVPDTTTNHDVELADTLGLLLGTLTVDGSPLYDPPFSPLLCGLGLAPGIIAGFLLPGVPSWRVVPTSALVWTPGHAITNF